MSFRGGIVDAALFLCVLGPCLFALGHLMGWIVGYEPRFDFMPFFLRVLLVTVILMPLAHRGRLSLVADLRRRVGNSQAWMVIAIIGFDLAVVVGAFVSSVLFANAAVELGVLATALVVSQAIYRRALVVHYRTADLA